MSEPTRIDKFWLFALTVKQKPHKLTNVFFNISTLQCWRAWILGAFDSHHANVDGIRKEEMLDLMAVIKA